MVPYLKGLVWRIIEHTAKLEDKRFGVTRFESVLLYPIEDSVSLQFDRGPRMFDNMRDLCSSYFLYKFFYLHNFRL